MVLVSHEEIEFWIGGPRRGIFVGATTEVTANHLIVEEMLQSFHSCTRAMGGLESYRSFEGDTDTRLFKLVSQLVLAKYGFDVEESLSLLPQGTGREGGTGKVLSVITGGEQERIVILLSVILMPLVGRRKIKL